MTTKEKAERYDGLMCAIGLHKRMYENELEKIDGEIKNSNETVGAMLIGKKYAYKEIVEIFGKWGLSDGRFV